MFDCYKFHVCCKVLVQKRISCSAKKTLRNLGSKTLNATIGALSGVSKLDDAEAEAAAAAISCYCIPSFRRQPCNSKVVCADLPFFAMQNLDHLSVRFTTHHGSPLTHVLPQLLRHHYTLYVPPTTNVSARDAPAGTSQAEQ